MDVMYFTRHVVAGACHVSITDWFVPFIGREYFGTCYIDTWHTLIGRSTFTELWSDGPPICEIWKKNYEQHARKWARIYWAGIYWHVAYWHVAVIDRTAHVYRAGTCHVGMIFVFPRFYVWNPVFCVSKVLFSSFAYPGRRIARIAIESFKRCH